MSVLLLDASVWLASRDEEDHHHALSADLVASTARGEVTGAALDLTLYEVANVAVRRWRDVPQARATAAIIREACGERLVRVDEELVDRLVGLSDDHGLSAYDAAYVACAQLHGWTLVSLDERDLVGPGHAVAPSAGL